MFDRHASPDVDQRLARGVIGLRAQATGQAIDRARARTAIEAKGEFERQDVATWGHAPELTLVAAVGLLALAAGYTASRFEWPHAEGLFWLGLVTVLFPVAVRLLGSTASRRERIALVVVLGVGLNLAKVLHDPLAVTFTDEFGAWLNVESILGSGNLFGHNPLHPATAYYPGLQAAISSMTLVGGVEMFPAAFLVVAAARLVTVLALFLFLEEVSSSARLAGIAVLVYAANPNFVFYGAQVGYESLALPFCFLALFLVSRQRRSHRLEALLLTVFAFASIVATVMTHHLTSIALAIFLVTWLMVSAARRSTRHEAGRIAPFALFAVVAAATWSLYVATIMVNYLSPVLFGAVADFYRLLTGEGSPRELFRYAGQVAPVWEQLTGYAAIALIVVGLPFGLWRIARHRNADPLAVTLALVALAYPATLVMRLTALGAETSNRTSEFLFVGIGFVLAVAATDVWLLRPTRWRVRAFATLATIIFVGGLVIGWARWARMPGPYVVGADTRSVERQGIEVAEWTEHYLGPGNRFVSDRTNRLLLGTYGHQRPVTGYGDLIDTKALIFSPRLGPAEEEVALEGNVRYVLIDRRLSTALPLGGIYVERGELAVLGAHRVPISSERLGKFDNAPRISRILDTGDIQIYDVERWWSR